MRTASTAGLTQAFMFAPSVCLCTYISICISVVVTFSVAAGAGYEEGKKILKNVGEIKSLQRWLKPSLVFWADLKDAVWENRARMLPGMVPMRYNPSGGLAREDARSPHSKHLLEGPGGAGHPQPHEETPGAMSTLPVLSSGYSTLLQGHSQVPGRVVSHQGL